MNKIGIFFGSSTGNTTVAAEKIAAQLGNADLHDVGEGVSSADFEGYDYLILGTSTWGCGDLQDDWETTLPELQKADLSGKTVALFALLQRRHEFFLCLLLFRRRLFQPFFRILQIRFRFYKIFLRAFFRLVAKIVSLQKFFRLLIQFGDLGMQIT